jgi:tyrosyl-tRNA synthetase
MELAQELEARGLVEHSSAELSTILAKKRTVYLGVDPTADSMHVGHLVPLFIMKRLSDAGHKPILLVGGGTGMIGDPRESGERKLSEKRVVEGYKKALRNQMQQIIGTRVQMVDNADWLLKVKFVDFLRDIGKHFTINELIKRDIIRRRLETPDESISYTEFAYSLLQGYDFMVLNEKYGCDLQIGGSDQWTNILSGVELIRKKLGKEAYAITFPLVNDPSGKKFGKSEGNAVWLDAKKTSPYQFYQFWLNQSDAAIERYLKVFTFMKVQEIDFLLELHRRQPEKREAQKMLAMQVTTAVHGAQAAKNAAAVSEVLFGGKPLSELSKEEQAALLKEAPSLSISRAHIEAGYPVLEAVVESGLATSKSDARRLIEGKGVTINGDVIETLDATLTLQQFQPNLALLRKGKQIVVLSIDK